MPRGSRRAAFAALTETLPRRSADSAREAKKSTARMSISPKCAKGRRLVLSKRASDVVSGPGWLSIPIEKLSVAIQKLSVAIETPSIAIQKPSIAVQKLSVAIETPSIAVQKLSIATRPLRAAVGKRAGVSRTLQVAVRSSGAHLSRAPIGVESLQNGRHGFLRVASSSLMSSCTAWTKALTGCGELGGSASIVASTRSAPTAPP